jgi:hypothetical protein
VLVIFILYYTGTGSWDSSVGVKINVGVDDLLFYFQQEKQTFSSPKPPDQLWVPPSLLFSGYWGFFPRGKVARVIS